MLAGSPCLPTHAQVPSCVIGLDLWALAGLIITKRLYLLICRLVFKGIFKDICLATKMKYYLICSPRKMNLSFTAFFAELWPLDMLV